MENPMLRNPFRSPYSPATHPNQRSPPSSRKVVSIPIHFVESETKIATKSSSALKIQKVFRGFLVRKSVKKIIGIKTEVDEIEQRLSQRETINLIKKDSKERLKMNEVLMALLLRLDSIRGVDSGVRELRKSVIKKAILLQERIDGIVAGSDQTLYDGKDGEMQEDPVESGNDSDDFENSVIGAAEEDTGTAISHNNPCAENQNGEKIDHISGTKEAEEVIENRPDEATEMNRAKKIKGREGEIVNGCNGLMEKMIEKNEKLMNLVTELCKKNVLQTQMISCLSQRVENLEKAYKSDRLRRKKKGELTKCGRKL